MRFLPSTQRTDIQPADSANRRVTLTAWLAQFHLDAPLLLATLAVCVLGLFVLYSADGENAHMVYAQGERLALGLIVMGAVAQVPPEWFKTAGPWLYAVGLILLAITLVLGDINKGAQRWIDLGLFTFQPAEIMKIAMPMTLALFLHHRPIPPLWRHLAVSLLILIVPVFMIAEQPDLGTALLITCAGALVIYLAGLRWRIILGVLLLVAALAPLVWLRLHGYQRQRIMIFLNPSLDPLGAGYHITQSKIAIGSGGLFGKGWLNGTQAQLDFLPESSTDFIFAVYAEEAGLLGALLLIILYACIVLRGLWIAVHGRDSFQRLLAGSLALTFSVYVIVNIGMVIGVLPVVGVPLPLISYGGTSMVTLLATLGMLMSIHTHRKMLST